jgi:hypothetical protein
MYAYTYICTSVNREYSFSGFLVFCFFQARQHRLRAAKSSSSAQMDNPPLLSSGPRIAGLPDKHGGARYMGHNPRRADLGLTLPYHTWKCV